MNRKHPRVLRCVVCVCEGREQLQAEVFRFFSGAGGGGVSDREYQGRVAPSPIFK